MEDYDYQIISKPNLRQLIRDIEEERLSHLETKPKAPISYVSDYSHIKSKSFLYNIDGRRASHFHQVTLQDQDLTVHLKKRLQPEKRPLKIIKTQCRVQTPDLITSTRKLMGSQYTPALQSMVDRIQKTPNKNRLHFPMRSNTPLTVNSLVTGKATYHIREKPNKQIEKKNVSTSIPCLNSDSSGFYIKVTRRSRRNKQLSDVVTYTDYL